MEITIPDEVIEQIELFSIATNRPIEEVVNESVRFFLMIHYLPEEDQTELHRIFNKSCKVTLSKIKKEVLN